MWLVPNYCWQSPLFISSIFLLLQLVCGIPRAQPPRTLASFLSHGRINDWLRLPKGTAEKGELVSKQQFYNFSF
jgi:hypothetical protein